MQAYLKMLLLTGGAITVAAVAVKTLPSPNVAPSPVTAPFSTMESSSAPISSPVEIPSPDIAISPTVPLSPAPTQISDSSALAGTYRCWSFNAGGRGGRCTNPPLVLKKTGEYEISSERGTFQIQGNQIILSESKFRGAGTISDDKMQIYFQYTYNGLDQSVTYLKDSVQEQIGSSIVNLTLTIAYPEGEDWLGSVSTIELEDASGKDKTVYTALALLEDSNHLKAIFGKGVYGGKKYNAYVSTGTDRVLAGVVDLTKASGQISKTIQAKSLSPVVNTPLVQSNDNSIVSTPLPTAEVVVPSPSSTPVTDQDLPLCDPSIPHYSQPPCRD